MSDPEILAAVTVAEDETLVEVPVQLLGYLERAGLVGPVTNMVPPIVYTTASGTYIIRGRRVEDTETLGQMHIPDNETCVTVSRTAVAALIGG